MPDRTDDDLDRILVAVRTELGQWGIDRFDVATMTDRHGLDYQVITQRWPDPTALILDALADRPPTDDPLPDTGSLHEDLTLLAVAMVGLITSEDGRRLHGAHLIADQQLLTVDIRRLAWRARASRLEIVFERARQRGELRDGVDHVTALELLFAPLNMRVLYTGETVDEDYCRMIAGMVCRAISTTD
ncbi:MAG: TetR-family transcriptional regulator [Mycobacterium sp.]|jgi:hypothetical protein|nr:TetR-family transcriptional regulator [Mycobacterium sp.]